MKIETTEFTHLISQLQSIMSPPFTLGSLSSHVWVRLSYRVLVGEAIAFTLSMMALSKHVVPFVAAESN